MRKSSLSPRLSRATSYMHTWLVRDAKGTSKAAQIRARRVRGGVSGAGGRGTPIAAPVSTGGVATGTPASTPEGSSATTLPPQPVVLEALRSPSGFARTPAYTSQVCGCACTSAHVHVRASAHICISVLCIAVSAACAASRSLSEHASAQFAFLAAAEYDAAVEYDADESANAEDNVEDDEGEGGDTILPWFRTARFSHGSSSGSLTCSPRSSQMRPTMHTTRSMLNDDGEVTITIGKLRRKTRLSRTRSSLARSLSLWT